MTCFVNIYNVLSSVPSFCQQGESFASLSRDCCVHDRAHQSFASHSRSRFRFQSAYAVGVNPKPLQILYGHDDKVTSVAISVELDLLVSGSKVR